MNIIIIIISTIMRFLIYDNFMSIHSCWPEMKDHTETEQYNITIFPTSQDIFLSPFLTLKYVCY